LFRLDKLVEEKLSEKRNVRSNATGAEKAAEIILGLGN
jgi:hypothetical protein